MPTIRVQRLSIRNEWQPLSSTLPPPQFGVRGLPQLTRGMIEREPLEVAPRDHRLTASTAVHPCVLPVGLRGNAFHAAAPLAGIVKRDGVSQEGYPVARKA
jgi:hypothetical protein